MIWLPILGLAAGLALGTISTFIVPAIYVKYLSIAVLAALDSIMGGVRAALNRNFDRSILLTGFFFNAILAAGLAYFGDRLGVDLYLAAVIAFGIRLFNNLGGIRRALLDQSRQKRAAKKALKAARTEEQSGGETEDLAPKTAVEPESKTTSGHENKKESGERRRGKQRSGKTTDIKAPPPELQVTVIQFPEEEGDGEKSDDEK